MPAQLRDHPQPWGHSLVLPRSASSTSDTGDMEFWVTYYPEKTEAKMNFGWSYFRSDPPGRALGLSLCSGGSLGVAPGLEGARTLPSASPVPLWGHQGRG